MTRLLWDQVGERTYESGVDRGVLYLLDGTGVPWNGLISVNETISTSVSPVYFDGNKYNEIISSGNYAAKLRAYTYPDEFSVFEGVYDDTSGFSVADQPPTRFHLSYRTKVNSDVEGEAQAYKIHILYNVTAVPSTKAYQTDSLTVSPIEFEWDISAVPSEVSGFKPTAHIIIDSRKIEPFLLEDVEELLYGSDDVDPRLPLAEGLAKFLRDWDRLIITSTSEGIWTAFSIKDGFIEMLDETTFQINNANAVYLDADTYEISNTEREEVQIWLP
jgi:hypothetical protein